MGHSEVGTNEIRSSWDAHAITAISSPCNDFAGQWKGKVYGHFSKEKYIACKLCFLLSPSNTQKLWLKLDVFFSILSILTAVTILNSPSHGLPWTTQNNTTFYISIISSAIIAAWLQSGKLHKKEQARVVHNIQIHTYSIVYVHPIATEIWTYWESPVDLIFKYY